MNLLRKYKINKLTSVLNDEEKEIIQSIEKSFDNISSHEVEKYYDKKYHDFIFYMVNSQLVMFKHKQLDTVSVSKFFLYQKVYKEYEKHLDLIAVILNEKLPKDIQYKSVLAVNYMDYLFKPDLTQVFVLKRKEVVATPPLL